MPDKKDAEKQFGERGVTGLPMWSGMVDDEFLPQLKGQKAIKIWREMADNDPIVGALLFAVDMLMRQVEWSVEPASADEEDMELADFVDSCLYDMSTSWEDTLSSILSFLPFGWSYHEIVYKYRRGDTEDGETRSSFDDGKIGWRKIPIRSQETREKWITDSNGGIRGMVQRSPQGGSLIIPIERALLFRTTSQKNNPEGRSVLRNAYRPWYFKKRIEEIEGVGIERDLAGLPIAYVPASYLSPDASNEFKQSVAIIQKIVTHIRRDEMEGIVFPRAYDEGGNPLFALELLSSGGSRTFDTDTIIGRYDQRISMTVLADFILLGHEKVGSFALGSSKIDLFSAALEAWLSVIADVFNTHAIPRLMRINGVDATRAPKLMYGKVQQVDLGALGNYIAQLTSAGLPMFPDPILQDHLKRVAGLPISDVEATGDLPDESGVMEGNGDGSYGNYQPAPPAPAPTPATNGVGPSARSGRGPVTSPRGIVGTPRRPQSGRS